MNDDRFFKVAATVWIVGALLSLGLVGVGGLGCGLFGYLADRPVDFSDYVC
jgi:hypothetical protein